MAEAPPLVPQIAQTITQAQAVAEVYRDSELRILSKIIDSLSTDLDSEDWALGQLARLQDIGAIITAELGKANAAAAQSIRDNIESAYTKGGVSVLQQLREHLEPTEVASPVKVAAVDAFVKDATTGLATAQAAIVRSTQDSVREIVVNSAAAAVTGTIKRPEAVQDAVREFLGKGLTGIQTGRGTMSLGDYAELAMRTTTSRAAIAGHTATMVANDLNLVVIHPGPRPCDICDGWARQVLSLDGSPAGTVQVTDIITGELVEIEIGGTLDDARDDGWNHPNCRCGVGAYLPGVTDPDIIERPVWDADGYAAQQDQRGIERDIRSAKTDLATAVTDDAAAAAKASVSNAQANMRSLLSENPDLKRQSSREQIGDDGD